MNAKPLLSGIYLFPFVISLSLSAVATGFIINKTGAYLPLITSGMLFMTLGFALFIDLPAQTSWSRLIIYQIIAGLGVGPNFQSPMLALQNSVAPHDIGPATSTFGFVRQLANAISVVVGGVVFQNHLKARRFMLIDAGIELRIVDLITNGSAMSSTMEIHQLPRKQRIVAQRAFAESMQKMWIMYACVGIVGLGLTDFVRKRALREEHEETKTGLAELERIRLGELGQKSLLRETRGPRSIPDVSENTVSVNQEIDRQRVEIRGKSAEVLGFKAPLRNIDATNPTEATSM